MNHPFLEIARLQKSFGLKPILRGIDLSLCAGERMALMGANGTGKTTLLRILAGLTRPSGGTATIDGLDIVRDVQQVRRLVGFVAHQPYLYDELTALENLLFFAKMYTVKDAQRRAAHLLQKVGLEKRARERVAVLSRGQVQRLSLARALLHSPHLLLLDEPDSGLDKQGYELIETLITEHTSQGGTVLFTTHQLERARQLGDSIAMLERGHITVGAQFIAPNIHQPDEKGSALSVGAGEVRSGGGDACVALERVGKNRLQEQDEGDASVPTPLLTSPAPTESDAGEIKGRS